MINSGNKFLDATPGSTTQALSSLDYGYLVDPDGGPIKVIFRQKIQSATWPAAGRGSRFSCSPASTCPTGTRSAAQPSSCMNGPFKNVNTPSGGGTVDYEVIKNNTGFTAGSGTTPATNDAAFMLPYFRVTSTGYEWKGRSPVRISRPFIIQSSQTI
jgi:hypothetical protein